MKKRNSMIHHILLETNMKTILSDLIILDYFQSKIQVQHHGNPSKFDHERLNPHHYLETEKQRNAKWLTSNYNLSSSSRWQLVFIVNLVVGFKQKLV